MKIKDIQYCSKCGKETVHYGDKHKFNWFMHFILFILTGFLWLIPFLFYYMSKKDKGYNFKCTNCINNQKTNHKEENKPSLRFIEKRLINEYLEENRVFDKTCKDTLIKQYLGEINLLKEGTFLSVLEKKELGLNTKLKLTQELINIFNLEKIEGKNPKVLLENFIYNIQNKVRLFDNVDDMGKDGVTTYILSSCNDESDCKWCRENNMKKFEVKDNLFEIVHNNCKCDYFRGVFLADIKM